MKVFGDTAYFVAILNRRDQHHQCAVAISRRGITHLVTTEFILLELGAALREPADRPDFLRIDQMLRTTQSQLLTW